MSNCIRVLHVVPELGYGGVEKMLLNYYEQLDHEKYKFDFVTHGDVENYHQDLTSRGCKLFYFKSLGQLGYRRYKKQVCKQIEIDKYDIVHIHTGHVVGPYAMIFRALKSKAWHIDAAF